MGRRAVEQVAIVNDAVQASHVHTTPGTSEIDVYDGPTFTSSSVTVVETIAAEPAPAVGGTGSGTRTQGYRKQRRHLAARAERAAEERQRLPRLAHQYIAAGLNRASLASTIDHVVAAIDASHTCFTGSAPAGFDAGATAELLNRFDEGQNGVPHCG